MTTELYQVSWNPAPQSGFPFVDPARIPSVFKPALWVNNYGIGDVAGARAGARLARWGGKLPPLGDVPLGFPNQIVPPNTFYALNLEGWSDAQVKLAIEAMANLRSASRVCAYGFYPAWPAGIGALDDSVLDQMEARLVPLLPWCRRMTNVVEIYIGEARWAESNLLSARTQLKLLRKYSLRVIAWIYPQFACPPTAPMTPFDQTTEDAMIETLRLFPGVNIWAPLAASIDMMERLAASVKLTI